MSWPFLVSIHKSRPDSLQILVVMGKRAGKKLKNYKNTSSRGDLVRAQWPNLSYHWNIKHLQGLSFYASPRLFVLALVFSYIVFSGRFCQTMGVWPGDLTSAAKTWVPGGPSSEQCLQAPPSPRHCRRLRDFPRAQLSNKGLHVQHGVGGQTVP